MLFHCLAIGLEDLLRKDQLVLIDFEVEVPDEPQYLKRVGVDLLIEAGQGLPRTQEKIGQFLGQKMKDIKICDLFELEWFFDVRLEDYVHLVICVDLLNDLSNQDAFDPLLHLLSTFLQQSCIRIFLGLRVERFFLQRDLDGGLRATVAHTDQFLLKIIDASSFLLCDLAGVEAAVGIVVDLFLNAIAITELVAGQTALAASCLTVVEGETRGRGGWANWVHALISSLFLLTFQVILKQDLRELPRLIAFDLQVLESDLFNDRLQYQRIC